MPSRTQSPWKSKRDHEAAARGERELVETGFCGARGAIDAVKRPAELEGGMDVSKPHAQA